MDKLKGIIGLIFLALWSPALIWVAIHLARACALEGKPWYLC